ncbi:GNAT family N-acetyltransferase [Alteromonas lipolytica]|uniref:N-acetyltransferase domain-containing protein n=1 Tax=Alteromonas lipolytica TaxID=1856405 RepID=A0A1E8FIS7_9ALTE|nr:GNAT family N-acetyltransferase [Alteromonas lipolytica]OFI35839.1 hypothetical protein BFC17_11205 [Alteromonas lipolytica]GGF81279.1 N-acetyltransferase [Alteromonas lipolytica]
MTNKVIIRSAETRDIAAVLPLMHKLAEFEGYRHQFKVTASSLRTIIEQNNDTGIVVADSADAIVGYLAYYYLPFTYDLSPWLVIKELFVCANARNRGVGQALFAQARHLCASKGGHKIKWEVLTQNHNAQRFYQRCGAQLEDEWRIMSLRVPPA